MKACVINDSGVLETVQRPEPRAARDVVKVQILIAPMCTEFKELRAGKAQEVLGHEAAGVVVDAAGSERVREGDRVVVMPGNACGVCGMCVAGEHIYCANQRHVLAETASDFGLATYAEYIVKPDRLLFRIPPDVSMLHASLACCGLGPSLNALGRMRARAGDTLLVSGCGPVGLGAVVNAVARSLRVIALEPTPYRADLARRLGAGEVLDPRSTDVDEEVRLLTGGRGADCAIETSGVRDAAGRLAALLRPLGRMALLAWDVPVELPPLVPLGIEVDGCWHWNHERDGRVMWETIRGSESALAEMVTHLFTLEDAGMAMTLQETGNCGKVVLCPDGPASLTDVLEH
jgi:L-iditol 2-dehydrogenase